MQFAPIHTLYSDAGESHTCSTKGRIMNYNLVRSKYAHIQKRSQKFLESFDDR